MARWLSKFPMIYVLLFCTSILGVARAVPGVAFGLTPDYGIAALSFGDESIIHIARIQGSPEYQAFMRRNDTAPPTTQNSSLCHYLSPALDYLPPALGFDTDICLSPDVTAVKPLIAALNKAVESYLGTKICYAALSLEDPHGHKTRIAQEALTSLGLRQVLDTIQRGRSTVSFQNPTLQPDCDGENDDCQNHIYDEHQPILAVEYSAHWVKVGLYDFWEGVSTIPVEGLIGDTIFSNGSSRLAVIREEVEYIFVNPPPDHLYASSFQPAQAKNISLPRDLHHLVIYGDDEKLEVLDLLEDIVGKELVREARISKSDFEAVGMIAETARDQMAWVNSAWFRTEAAFGCKWRSGLYQYGWWESPVGSGGWV